MKLSCVACLSCKVICQTLCQTVGAQGLIIGQFRSWSVSQAGQEPGGQGLASGGFSQLARQQRAMNQAPGPGLLAGPSAKSQEPGGQGPGSKELLVVCQPSWPVSTRARDQGGRDSKWSVSKAFATYCVRNGTKP